MNLFSELMEKKLPCGHVLKFVANSLEGAPGELPHQKGDDLLSYYDELIRIHNPKPRRLLEIGICRGGSLAMWPLIFESVEVVGVDIDPSQISGACTEHYGEPDQSITVIQDRMPSPAIATRGPFDFIVDDGAHGADGAIKSFDLLWPQLSNGGLYVVEDWHANDMAMKDVILHLAQKEVGYWPASGVVEGGIAVFHVWRSMIAARKVG